MNILNIRYVWELNYFIVKILFTKENENSITKEDDHLLV